MLVNASNLKISQYVYGKKLICNLRIPLSLIDINSKYNENDNIK